MLLQVALLVIETTFKTSVTRATASASALGIAGTVILLITSHLEHGRSVRTSTVLVLYLGYSCVADALRVRTLWSMPDNALAAAVHTTIPVVKAILVTLELCRKQVMPGIRRPTRDERAGIISRMFLWWLLPVLKSGQNKTPLTPESLPDIEHTLKRAGDAKKPGDEKEKQKLDAEGGDDNAVDDILIGSSVFRHIWAVRGWLILSAVPPRFAYSGFLFAQPFLINKATNWLAAPFDDNTYKIGGGLIGAYAIVYIGLGVRAIFLPSFLPINPHTRRDSCAADSNRVFINQVQASQAFYRQCTARAITAVRADLVSKIHSHSLKLSASSSAQDSASTLMSADVERFVTGTRNLHEAWASPIELGIGLFILKTQIGPATAAAAGLTVVFIALTGLIAGSAGKRQNEWLKGMEERISGTTQALKAMRGIKMTGISPVVRRDIIELRKSEIRQMRRFRQVMIVVLWSMFIPVIMGPVLAFTVYNVWVGPQTGVPLTPAMVFQVLTILGIFGNSIAVLLESSVNIVTAGASLLRIQAFLLGENTREDKRALLPGSNSRLAADGDDEEPFFRRRPQRQPAQSSGGVLRLNSIRRKISGNPSMLRLSRACAGWSTEGPMVVSNANLEVSGPSIIAVVGPTGSGKTTLLRMLLGETEHADGVIGITSRRIGYCSQTPWLTHASVRENIVGGNEREFDEDWYNAVLHATALHRDIGMMASGDATVVGNAGSSLSGGQKKRIALARAVYSRAPIFILDDPFNGLDGRTETAVLEALFGQQGLLRSRHPALVVWATSAGMLPFQTARDVIRSLPKSEPVKQARFADRVVSLTDSGDVRKRDSLLASFQQQKKQQKEQQENKRQAKAQKQKHSKKRASLSWFDDDSPESSGLDEGDQQDWSTTDDNEAKRLSTIEVFEGIVVGRSDPQQTLAASAADEDDVEAHKAGKDPAAYRYYIGGGGKRKFLVFLGMITMFIGGSLVSRE